MSVCLCVSVSVSVCLCMSVCVSVCLCVAEWLSNKVSPFAAYWTLMACRLVTLDKEPGMRPVGIEEIWRQAMENAL